MIFRTTASTDFFDECVTSCSKVARRQVVFFSCLFLLISACSQTPRTATNFCRQLAKETPFIGDPPVTAADVVAMLERYERLSKATPLVIEDEWNALTELLAVASRVKSSDGESVQAVIDMAYSTEKSALTAAKWTKETCGVDISNGLKVAPQG
jgi:hypothetical protein